MTIKINNTGICIRPSSVDNFQQCPYQWGKVFLEGIITIPNARAAIGTGIHRGAEVMWQNVMKTKDKQTANLTEMQDAAVEEFEEETKKGSMRYDNGENKSTAISEVAAGTKAFLEDIVPFVDIPEGVEKRFDVELKGHPVVSSVGGTIDYIGSRCIDDIKTSKRKPSPPNYVTQQSIYKFLAEENGVKVDFNRIQGVVLTKNPYGTILDLQPNVEQAKYVVNTILETIEIAAKDIVPIDVLFRCNTKYYLCSPKYCSQHGSCPATKRTANAEEKPKL